MCTKKLIESVLHPFIVSFFARIFIDDGAIRIPPPSVRVQFAFLFYSSPQVIDPPKFVAVIITTTLSTLAWAVSTITALGLSLSPSVPLPLSSSSSFFAFTFVSPAYHPSPLSLSLSSPLAYFGSVNPTVLVTILVVIHSGDNVLYAIPDMVCYRAINHIRRRAESDHFRMIPWNSYLKLIPQMQQS